MRIALAGLGRMGVPMAERLLAAGHELVVWNRTRARAEEFAAASGQARVAHSPAELLADGGLCLTMLADDAAVEAVAGEVLGGARRSGTAGSGTAGSGTAGSGTAG